MAIYSGFTHWKWWIFPVRYVAVYQRVNFDLLQGFCGVPKMTSLYSTWIVLDSNVHLAASATDCLVISKSGVKKSR